MGHPASLVSLEGIACGHVGALGLCCRRNLRFGFAAADFGHDFGHLPALHPPSGSSVEESDSAQNYDDSENDTEYL